MTYSVPVWHDRWSFLADSIDDVLWVIAADGRMTHVSGAIWKLRGLTPQEAMAQTVDQIHTPDSAARSVAYFTHVLTEAAAGRQADPFHGQLEYYRKDGSTFWTDVMAAPIYDAAGRLVEVVGITRDLTSQRLREQELSREAEARMVEFRRTMSDVMVHEVRTTLSVAMMVLGRLPASDGQRDVAERAVRQLDRVMEQFVTAGALEDNAAHPAPLMVEPALRDVVALRGLDPRARFDVAPGAHRAMADPDLLTLLLTQLLDNAATYAPPGGTIHLALRAADRGGRAGVVIVLRNDPGPFGLPDAEAVMRPFARGRSARSVSGSGLGLPIARAAAERMGGEVTMQTDDGRVTLRVWLPAA